MSDKPITNQRTDHAVMKMTIVAITLVTFACIVVFTTLALIIIDEIPFHHLFDGSDCGIGAGILIFHRLSETFHWSNNSLDSEPEQNEIAQIGDQFR